MAFETTFPEKFFPNYHRRRNAFADETAAKWDLDKTTYVGDDCKLGQHVQDGEPDPDVLRPLRDGPPGFADEFLSVEPNLDPVVEQGEERGQRERRHEDRDETELEHFGERKRMM